MFCELRLISAIENLQKCQQYLFGDESSETGWFHKCIVELSPTGDLLVLAHGTALIVLTSKFDRSTNSDYSPRLTVTHQWDAVEYLNVRDNITSVACLPLVSVESQSQGLDWTCIAVGFLSGHIRFFTENMDLIVSERLHTEPLLHIKATSYRKKREKKSEGNDSSEAVYAVYPSVLCHLSGFSLFQTIRGCRSDIALKLAHAKTTDRSVTLDYKKYAFSTAPINDACFIGCATVTSFDNLVSTSLSEGFYSNYRPSPPQHSLIVSTGNSSWLRIQHTMEGIAAPLNVTDVAFTVINKLPGWLKRNKNKTSEPAVRPAEKLAQHCQLLDRRRDGTSVVPSPDGSLLAVSDSLGRVSLVDVRSGVALRMWKGYRDAQCGFLEIEEELVKTRHRHRHISSATKGEAPSQVSVLVIFAPKKGLIEIHPLRYGPRIGALRVSKNGQLISNNYGLLGFSTAPKKKASGVIPLAFVSEEGLMEIHVPFYCALMDASAQAKDLHLLMQLKGALREIERKEDDLITEVTTVMRQLKTDQVRLQALDLLSSLKITTPAVFYAALDVLLEAASESSSNSSGKQRNLLAYSKQLRKVIKLYSFLQELSSSSVDQPDKLGTPLSELLMLPESEAAILFEFVKRIVDLSGSRKEARVKFSETAEPSLSHFLDSFDLADSEPILQKPSLPEEGYRLLGEFLFRGVSQNLAHLAVWKEAVQSSTISPSVVARCLVTYWLQRPLQNMEQDIHMFILLLKTVTFLSDESVASADCNLESPWWTELRAIISTSSNTAAALMIAICCRAVSLMCEQDEELKRFGTISDSITPGWESVSADTWQWDVLITHLEDVALLNTILSVKPAGQHTIRLDLSEISLSGLVASGEDAVSELVAKWLCQFMLPPNLFIDKTDFEFQTMSIDSDNVESKGSRRLKGDNGLALPLIEIAEEVQLGSEVENTILGHLRLLKKRFPYSLTCSALLSHMGWELMSKWQRDLPDISLLASALKYLEAIPSAQLKAGVCCLAWTTYVKVHLEGMIRLVGKVGKLPTDVLCMREVGIPRAQTSHFLALAVNLLSAILDAIAERPQTPFLRQREALWQGGKPGLVGLAVTRPPPCEDVVLLHHQITVVIHMVASLELRDRKVLASLLESVSLFGELTQQRNLVLHHTGKGDALLLFLGRAVAAAVQTIHTVECDGGGTRLDATTACRWVRVCYDLASAWRLPTDTLRRQHVCQLYSHGCDRLAEEVLPAVNDTTLLASQLLVVAGQRLKALLAASEAPETFLSNLSPMLTSWLNSLEEEELKESRVSLRDTETLMTRVLQWLPEGHEHVNLATQLVESVHSILVAE